MNRPTSQIIANFNVTQILENNMLLLLSSLQGADLIEFDVQLTKDDIPVIYCYYYLFRELI